MTEIRFYHLTKKTLEEALPDLLGKALENNKRIVLKLDNADKIPPMSKHLWVCRRNGFFPHGISGDGNEDIHPIWLTASDNDNPNNADMLVLAEGASDSAISDYDLVCEMFNGRDNAQTEEARKRWKNYKDEGHELVYFQQDEKGSWQKKA